MRPAHEFQIPRACGRHGGGAFYLEHSGGEVRNGLRCQLGVFREGEVLPESGHEPCVMMRMPSLCVLARSDRALSFVRVYYSG